MSFTSLSEQVAELELERNYAVNRLRDQLKTDAMSDLAERRRLEDEISNLKHQVQSARDLNGTLVNENASLREELDELRAGQGS